MVYATGGPAGMYADSVYPAGHYGATAWRWRPAPGPEPDGMAVWAGLCAAPVECVGYLYAGAAPDVLRGRGRRGEREFLMDFFQTPQEMLSKLFLKGYQWPFDVRKVAGGSSIIDILVYLETCKGRRVFLDYRRNPGDGEIPYHQLEPEAREYLERAGACFGTPIQRLSHMNQPAVDFYRDKGVDLASQPLEISLCAQHNNGGLAVDCWWQTEVAGLFAAGEAAASHGVYRPAARR